MVSEPGFEFAIEKANFLENVQKNRGGEESWGVSLKHQLQGNMGQHRPLEDRRPPTTHLPYWTGTTKSDGQKHSVCCSHADPVSLPSFTRVTRGLRVGARGCSGQSSMTIRGCVLALRVHPSSLWCQTPTIFGVVSWVLFLMSDTSEKKPALVLEVVPMMSKITEHKLN